VRASPHGGRGGEGAGPATQRVRKKQGKQPGQTRRVFYVILLEEFTVVEFD